MSSLGLKSLFSELDFVQSLKDPDVYWDVSVYIFVEILSDLFKVSSYLIIAKLSVQSSKQPVDIVHELL